jgi:hypothetical protein
LYELARRRHFRNRSSHHNRNPFNPSSMNNQTTIAIETLKADTKLLTTACECVFRLFGDWYGIINLNSPKRLAELAEELEAELLSGISEERLEDCDSITAAIIRDSFAQIDWVEVARFVIPKFKEEANFILNG